MPLSKFYLSVFIDTLKTSGWSIFRVRGNFPRDCPDTNPNGFGQWLTPEDVKNLSDEIDGTKTAPPPPPRDNDYDLNAAIAASLMEYLEAATLKCDPYTDTDVPYDTDDDDDDDECTLAGIPAVGFQSEETKDCTHDDDSGESAVQKTENAKDQ